jgi:hypothetical protein
MDYTGEWNVFVGDFGELYQLPLIVECVSRCIKILSFGGRTVTNDPKPHSVTSLLRKKKTAVIEMENSLEFRNWKQAAMPTDSHILAKQWKAATDLSN